MEPIRVLAVDDDPCILRLLRRALGSRVELVAYSTVDEALAILAEATSRALLNFGDGSNDSYATSRAGTSTPLVSLVV